MSDDVVNRLLSHGYTALQLKICHTYQDLTEKYQGSVKKIANDSIIVILHTVRFSLFLFYMDLSLGFVNTLFDC